MSEHEIDPYVEFWDAADFKHPTGHSMRLVRGLMAAKRALEKQGQLGQMAYRYFARTDTR